MLNINGKKWSTINLNLGGLSRGLSYGQLELGPVATLCLELFRIMLETRNLIHNYKHICSFRKYTLYYLEPLSSDDVSICVSQVVSLLEAVVWELWKELFSAGFNFS